MDLHIISEHYRKPDAHPAPADFNDVRPEGPDHVPPERFASFSVTTDKKWNIVTISSIFKFNMDSEFYESAKKEALTQNKNRGKFKLDGNDWAFTVQPVPEGYMIVFLNITSQQAIVTNLVYTFIVVALMMNDYYFLYKQIFCK